MVDNPSAIGQEIIYGLFVALVIAILPLFAKRIWRFLRSVDQVAAVCYRIQNGQIEFLLIQTTGHRWMFPKGRIRFREPLWRTAQLKAHEEAGVYGKISHQCLTTFRHLKQEFKPLGREVAVAAYLLKVETTYEPSEPHRKPTWLVAEQALNALSQSRYPKYTEEVQNVIHLACLAIESNDREAI